MHEQTVKRLADTPIADGLRGGPRVSQTLAGNAENQVHHMIEVFLRMDVTLSQTSPGAPVDKKLHRIVSFEPAASPGRGRPRGPLREARLLLARTRHPRGGNHRPPLDRRPGRGRH